MRRGAQAWQPGRRHLHPQHDRGRGLGLGLGLGSARSRARHQPPSASVVPLERDTEIGREDLSDALLRSWAELRRPGQGHAQPEDDATRPRGMAARHYQAMTCAASARQPVCRWLPLRRMTAVKTAMAHAACHVAIVRRIHCAKTSARDVPSTRNSDAVIPEACAAGRDVQRSRSVASNAAAASGSASAAQA